MVLDEVDDRKKNDDDGADLFFGLVLFKRRVDVFIFRVLKVRLECLLFFFVRDLSCVCGLKHS